MGVALRTLKCKHQHHGPVESNIATFAEVYRGRRVHAAAKLRVNNVRLYVLGVPSLPTTVMHHGNFVKEGEGRYRSKKKYQKSFEFQHIVTVHDNRHIAACDWPEKTEHDTCKHYED